MYSVLLDFIQFRSVLLNRLTRLYRSQIHHHRQYHATISKVSEGKALKLKSNCPSLHDLWSQLLQEFLKADFFIVTHE